MQHDMAMVAYPNYEDGDVRPGAPIPVSVGVRFRFRGRIRVRIRIRVKGGCTGGAKLSRTVCKGCLGRTACLACPPCECHQKDSDTVATENILKRYVQSLTPTKKSARQF